MDHREAIETMASERYLLDELSPEVRAAYEEHLFSCTDCASDTLSGAAFISRAKEILPTMKCGDVLAPRALSVKALPPKRDWLAWLRPTFAVPVFASLIGILAYQNVVTFPALQSAASEPQVLPAAVVLHGDTRGGHAVVHGDLIHGSTIMVELPQQGSSYVTYKFVFYDSHGKLIASRSAENSGETQDTQTIWLPGRVKQDTYKIALSGITASGETVAIREQFFDLQIKK